MAERRKSPKKVTGKQIKNTGKLEKTLGRKPENGESAESGKRK